MDIVNCTNCGYVGEVETYSDICPRCLLEGTLQDVLKQELYNGDCIQVLSTLADSSIDLVLTDPPYGVAYQNNYTLNKHKKIANDDVVDYLTFGKECFRVLKDNSHAYFFTRFDTYPQHYQQLKEAGFTIKNVLVIEKGHVGGVGDLKGSFSNNSEWIIFCQKGRREFEETKLMKNMKPTGKKCARDGQPVPEYKRRFFSCWFGENYPKSTYNASWQKKHGIYHPTIKNVACLDWLIQISSKEYDVVLDSFMGSGSTGMACKGLNRHFIGIEIDKGYYEMAKKRLESNLGL